MNVSIIYVNYKTASLILDSIKSVKEKTEDVDYEIIVVDNASDDSSLELIQKQYPEVICVQAVENLGFGRANNLGMTYASGDCILFLNPDTILRNDAIDKLYAYLIEHPNVGACGGNLYDEQGLPTTSFSRKFPSFIWEFLSILYISPICLSFPQSVYFNKEGKPIPVASIIGADLMVQKSIFLEVGGFSPEFFMNYEETELCYRIARAGFSIYSVPCAQITHLEGRASYIKQSRLYFYMRDNIFIFVRFMVSLVAV